MNAGAGIDLTGANLASTVALTNSTSGNIVYDNYSNMTLSAANSAEGGTIVVNATGTLGTSGAITTTGTTGAEDISLQTAGGLTISNAVTAGGTGSVTLAGVGVTISNTVTGPGGLTVNAGTGELINTATTGVLTNGSDAAAISLIGNTMALNGTVTGGSGNVSLTSSTVSNPIMIGTGSSGLVLSNAALNTISTTGTLTIGDTLHTGTITTGSAVTGGTNTTGAWVFQTSGGTITLNNAVTTPNSLTLSTTGDSATTGVVTAAGLLTIGADGSGSLTVNTSAGIDLTGANLALPWH